jgi:hypothetical protein
MISEEAVHRAASCFWEDSAADRAFEIAWRRVMLT